MANQKTPIYEEENQPGSTLMKVIGALACFGLAVLMVYLSLAEPQQGTAMVAIRNITRGIGGSLSVLLSLIFVWVGALFVFSARGKKLRVWRILMNALLFICVFTGVQLFSAQEIIESHMRLTTFPNFVSCSYQLGTGGGALGALLAYPLYMGIGSWGGLIVTILFALLSLTATGHTQKFVRWTRRNAETARYKSDQRRKVKEQERMFDYSEYDELEMQPQPPRSRPQSRRRVEEDYMIINSTPEPAQPRRKAEPAPKTAPARKKKLYKEVIDREAAVEEPTFEYESDLEIPKPLRKLRESRKPVQEETPQEAAAEIKPASHFPRDVKDIFDVEPEEEESVVQPEPVRPEPAARYTPPKKTIVEGTRALGVDDVPATQHEDIEDDDTPFDIPHSQLKKQQKAQAEAARREVDYKYPPMNLLGKGEKKNLIQENKEIDRQKGELLVKTLQEFGVETKYIGSAHGPAVTCLEIVPAPGVQVNKIKGRADDIALRLAVESVRIEAPIPGKAAVGIEIPNEKKEIIYLRDVLESQNAKMEKSRIAFGLGKDNSGRFIMADIAKMPHMLVAGETGSGKSVCINSIIVSILYRATPDEVRLILIDPKVVELQVYNDIPHLIAPVVTDPKKAASALNWAVAEMMNRYDKFAKCGVRNIAGYNEKLAPGEEKMPRIVIIIDELADLMMVAPGEVEDSICRLTQLARAAGMHLIVATQRPSVNVVTGLIKANIPTRVAFQTSSIVDSRTIIEHGGAEKLLGHGDMLFKPGGKERLRIQGSFISDEEVISVVEFIKANSSVGYDEDVVEKIENSVLSDAEKEEKRDCSDKVDERLEEAIEIVVMAGQASISMLQRKMGVGYARAGKLIDEMERRGIISPADGAKPREVLITREQFYDMFQDEE